MTVYLSAFAGAGWQFFDANGTPLSGGKIYVYVAGTTTPAVTYTSSTGSVPHANPIILNSAGRIAEGEIWQPAGTEYKYVLKTSTDTLIGTFDNIGTILSGVPTVANLSGNGSQTVYTFASPPVSANAVNIYINGVYQEKSTYTVAGSILTFSEAPPYGATIEAMFF